MNMKDKLKDLLMEYFSIGDSYSYNLTRVKSAFAVGTVSLEDFEEFDEEFIDDIVEYIMKNMGELKHEQIRSLQLGRKYSRCVD